MKRPSRAAAVAAVALAFLLAYAEPSGARAMSDGRQGGPGPDVMIGGIQGDGLFGRGGDDQLRGRGGPDFLKGGAGSDRVAGGAGDDQLWDGPGDDVLRGGSGADWLLAGAGRDVFNGGRGDDQIDLTADHRVDVVHCGPGQDLVELIGGGDPRDRIGTGCEEVLGQPSRAVAHRSASAPRASTTAR